MSAPEWQTGGSLPASPRVGEAVSAWITAEGGWRNGTIRGYRYVGDRREVLVAFEGFGGVGSLGELVIDSGDLEWRDSVRSWHCRRQLEEVGDQVADTREA